MVKNALVKRYECPFCNSLNFRQIYKKKFLSNNIKSFLKKHLNNFPLHILKNKNFVVAECEKCSGIFQEYILNDTYNKLFYEKYVPHDVAFNKKQKSKDYFNKVYNYEMFLIKKYFKNENKINVLEIGAGWGFWSLHIKKNNLDVAAVEISKTRRNFMKKNKIKTFRSLDLVKKKFHFIFSDQTFEHLSNPLDTLRKVSKLLKKGGIIYLKVPPGIYIKNKLNHNYRVGEDEIIPLEHINVYNKKVNSVIAKILGLRYLYPKNPYSFFSLEYVKKLLINFYEYHSSKTIIFQKTK